MRLYIPDMSDFFSWMDKSGYRYAVLRDFFDLDGSNYPAPGAKRDIDLLVEDTALAPVYERYKKYKRRQGIKCDLYDRSGTPKGAYLDHPYLPPALADTLLTNRILWKEKFFVPAPHDHLLSLAHHIAYQKAERSKIDFEYPERSQESKYAPVLNTLAAQLSLPPPLTLTALHALLKQSGYAPSFSFLVSYLQHDFAHHVKSYFLARLCDDYAGEMNLFVIRRSALSKKKHEQLLDFLREHYTILEIKNIPFLTRLTKARKMRGGKWRRGGYPCIAVVVFDPRPTPTTADDRKVHPFVFNARQFIKREWREWFTKTTGAKPSTNPIHSTDNEAEAIGHLPMFFTQGEQAGIFSKLAALRERIPR